MRPSMLRIGGQQNCIQAALPFIAWLCSITVALSVRYGYYGDRRLELGPSSSRLVTASSAFVERIVLWDEAQRGVMLYGFSREPELSSETNRSVSKVVFIDSYGHQGLGMWLNRGSKIKLKWEVAYGGAGYKDMVMVLIKGTQKFEELERYYINSYITIIVSETGNREAKYNIEEEDNYYIGLVNYNSRPIAVTFNVNVSSKMYDISKASSICSTITGSCKAKLLFPQTRYFVVGTPDYNMSSGVWHAELSFEARLIAYLIRIGLVVVIVCITLDHCEACTTEITMDEATANTETEPILPINEAICKYGTIEEDPESGLCYSSEDLYDGKICIICYDRRSNCFFTPCGHNATCYTCAQRILKEDNKVCPICRRLVGKIKRLSTTLNVVDLEGEDRLNMTIH